MPDLRPPKVLVVARTEESKRRLTAALEGFEGHVWWNPRDVPKGTRIELLVTDSWPDAEQQSWGLPVKSEDECLTRPKVTVLGIGPATEPWADLSLPGDFTTRELRAACTLLGEIGRLRAERDEAARASHESRQLAHTDPLTGLPNRRVWDSRLEAHCRRTDSSSFWLAIADLDRFKQVNDRCGLAVGDYVLRRVAESLARSVRRDDLVARLGGDEFGILLCEIDEAAVRSVLDRLRRAVAELEHANAVGRVTVSIGYVRGNPNSDGVALLATAELGLRRAKQSGGSCVCRADETSE